MKAEFLGHATWFVENQGTKILFDPWLKDEGNPQATKRAEEIEADYILVSHGHDDHAASTLKVARKNDATVIATFELANKFGAEGAKVHPMHVGGTYNFPFGRVRVTPAFHGSGVPGGHACGFIINLHGKVAYHAGDTSLFGDMKLLGELETIDVAFLPIGGNFTMDADDALQAARLLGARVVVPMHYGTFPIIPADPRDFKRRVESQTSSRVEIVTPGGVLEI